jgi:hypothetical protein
VESNVAFNEYLQVKKNSILHKSLKSWNKYIKIDENARNKNALKCHGNKI